MSLSAKTAIKTRQICAISEALTLKIFRGNMPPDPPRSHRQFGGVYPNPPSLNPGSAPVVDLFIMQKVTYTFTQTMSKRRLLLWLIFGLKIFFSQAKVTVQCMEQNLDITKSSLQRTRTIQKPKLTYSIPR